MGLQIASKVGYNFLAMTDFFRNDSAVGFCKCYSVTDFAFGLVLLGLGIDAEIIFYCFFDKLRMTPLRSIKNIAAESPPLFIVFNK